MALFRIAFALFLLIFGLPNYRWIGTNPDAFFFPPSGPARLLNGFPPAYLFDVASIALAALAVLLLFGYRTKTASVLFALIAVAAHTFEYSFGKIDHDDTFRLVLPLVMAFSGWGNRLSVDAWLEANGRERGAEVEAWPVAVVATIIGVGFLSAGLPKYFPWIDFDLTTQGVRDWVFTHYYVRGKRAFLLPFIAQINNPIFWEAMDVGAVVFELGFFLSLAVPRAFRAYVGVAVLFHIANYLMLNIAFVMLFPVYMLFMPWTEIAERLQVSGHLKRLRSFMRLRTATISMLLYVPLAWWASNVVASGLPTTPLALLVAPLSVSYEAVLNVGVFLIGFGAVAWVTAQTLRRTFASTRPERQTPG